MPRRSVRKTPAARGETIFAILRREHRWIARQLAQLLAMIDEGAEADDCVALLEQIEGGLLAHSRAEEEVVYPVIARASGARIAIAAGYEEHAVVDHVLRALRASGEVDTQWAARVKVLADVVKRHVREEEGPVFRIAERALTAGRARELAVEYRRAKTILLGKAVSRRRGRGDAAARLH